MTSTLAPQLFACRCLNVRLQAEPATTAPPDSASDPVYAQVFVGDEGIQVAHPQATIRIKTPLTPISGISRCSRFTTLICLLCDLNVYRVFQISSADIEGEDGPLLPANDWVEREIMKSSSGWIEIHKDCLVGTAVTQATTHHNYSTAFSVLLPPPSSRPPSPKTNAERPPSRTISSSPEPPPSYLSHTSLFPPPPFTPSHQTFLHLASLAEKESQAHRVAAEQQIADLVREKVADMERIDNELRQQVEVLWWKFKRSINEVQKERNSKRTLSPTNHKDQNHKFGVNGVGSPPATTIRDFKPVSVLNPARVSLSPGPRVSALSASLATTSFHYPKANQSRSPPPQSNGSPNSVSSQTLSSTHSESVTLVQSAGRSEGSNVLQFRRNINDSINTAASFRYFVNLEEDISRHRRERQASNPTGNNQQAGPSQTSENPTTSADNNNRNDQPETQVGEGSAGPRGRGRGNRRVTFDVQPDVVTIKREVGAENAEQEALAEQDPREIIFELEDLDGVDQSPKSRHTLPLIEQPAVFRPSRPGKSRQQANGLSGSFSSLRPSSLPAPSHIRPIRSQPGVDSSSQAMMMSLPRLAPVPRAGPSRVAEGKAPDARDAEILKLVAADIPSHRGAWKLDGKAWQTFTRRQGSKDHLNHDNIPEEGEYETEEMSTETNEVGAPGEDEDEDEDEGYDDFPTSLPQIPSSVPINIINRSRQREVLSLASYVPKSNLADENEPGPSSTTHKASSSVAMRKAAYAERDRSRSMDPGALDFADEEVDEEEDGESESEPQGNTEGDAGGRGRKRALKILQARSELPPSGMWRSLAS